MGQYSNFISDELMNAKEFILIDDDDNYGGEEITGEEIVNIVKPNETDLEEELILQSKISISEAGQIEFNRNQNKFTKFQCGKTDTHERAYKIKNLLKDLPTYKILNNRQVNRIDSALCPSCEKKEEDWEHVWTCECNISTIRKIIEEAVYDYELLLKKEERLEEVAIIQEYNFNFISILYEKSLILIDRTREWELLRGIYNNRFNRISRKKKYKQ
ncbi:hypothetical protein GLOIN_2v1488717 [Rhizophagus clarus]|uniref:Uncharacterized protein n=1 Tax=Rhizophagus clarus TaxID=94130 RepID=A0A8H3MCL1_9GLOM|nr:hypothetical protein GLOIN_2v1488717 [Rhizophagus clarus]